MSTQAILVTVSGPDRPGITATLMSVIVNSHHEILDIGQSVTHGLLSLSFLLDTPYGQEKASPILKDLLFEAKGMGLSLEFEVVDKDFEVESNEIKYVLTCVSPIKLSAQYIQDVATTLAQHKVNILRIDNLSKNSLHSLEMYTSASPDSRWEELKENLVLIGHQHTVDMAFLEASIYRTNKRLIVMDMDSTLIQTEVIDELAKLHGVEEEIKEITDRAMNGEMDFAESLRLRVSYLKGLKISSMQEVAQNLPITEGAEQFIKKVKSRGYKVALITGGFTYFANYLKDKLGLDYSFANELEFDEGVLSGRVKGNIIDAGQKAFLMDLLAQQEQISLDQVVAIGDGANDLPMLKKAGLGIAFHAKQIVRKNTRQEIGHGPMTSILTFLGIPH